MNTCLSQRADWRQSAALGRAVTSIASGSVALLVDQANPTAGASLVMAAEAADARTVGFIVRYSSGLICAPMSKPRFSDLELGSAAAAANNSGGAAVAVSVSLGRGQGPSVAAEDRAATLRALADRRFCAADFRTPGHVFAFGCNELGVLERARSMEAAQDLVLLAGRGDVGVCCEVVADDGELLQGRRLESFASSHDIPMVDIAEIIDHRLRSETLVRRLVSTRLPSMAGDGSIHLYESRLDGAQHVVVTVGDPKSCRPPLCRLHCECFAGDVLRSLRCDCHQRLAYAMCQINEAGAGVLVYLRPVQRNAFHMLTTASEEHARHDTEPRIYTIGGQILRDLGFKTLRLMEDDPLEGAELARVGLEVAEHVAPIDPTHHRPARTAAGRGKQARPMKATCVPGAA